MASLALSPEVCMEKNVSLLIADDNQDTLDILLYKVGTCGWSAKSVMSASQIIEAVNVATLEGHAFDAIIADVNFYDNQPGPRMTGITAVREIRKVQPDVPVIFVTAYTNSLMREEVRRLDSKLVPKPFDPDFLFDLINELVAWHRATLPQKYDGEERRKTSFNLSGHMRRATDKPLAPSPRIAQVLAQLRDESR